MTNVVLERADAIATITLNRPERLNAIGTQLLIDLHSVLTAANNDSETKVIILTGAGRAFCAGDDLKEVQSLLSDRVAVTRHIEAIQQISRDLLFSKRPVIGAIHGYAVGGGFEWLLNCDMVVAADDLIAFFPEMHWGYFVTGGVTHLLPQAVGRAVAMELMVLGERIDAARLLELRLVNWVTSRDSMIERAIAVARTVTERASGSVSELKRALSAGPAAPLEAALRLEQDVTIECFLSNDARERSRAFGR
jgi:enoyl-CoA hydratase/carnithine racemase